MAPRWVAAISRTPRHGVQTLGRGHDGARRGCERLTKMASPRGDRRATVSVTDVD